MESDMCGNEGCRYLVDGHCHATQDYRDACRAEAQRIIGDDTPCETIKAAMDTFGIEKQLIKFIEELGELQSAISRWYQDGVERSDDDHHFDNLCEELADVEIMSAQVDYYIGITSERVDYWREYKLDRLAKLIKNVPKRVDDDSDWTPEAIAVQRIKIELEKPVETKTVQPDPEPETQLDPQPVIKSPISTKSEVREMIKLRRDGASYDKIAAQMNVSYGTIQRRFAKIPGDRDLILKFWANGGKVEDISSDTGVDINSVREFLDSWKLPHD